MSQPIIIRTGYFGHTTTSTSGEHTYRIETKSSTQSDLKCYTSDLIPKRDKISSVDDFLADFLDDPSFAEEVKKARTWVADTFHDKPSIKSFRLKAGFSQTELADLMNTSQAQIAKIEKGNQDLMYSTLKKLSLALGVTLNDLDEALSS